MVQAVLGSQPKRKMSIQEDYWFMIQFKLKLLQASGEAFQVLFNDLMFAKYGHRYHSVRPWGAQGDGGNDGFVGDEGRYFQVYGPHINTDHEVKAVAKAAKDFEKLKADYPSMTSYSFVLNDRYAGVPAPVHKSLSEISSKHGVAADAMSSGHMEQSFMDLESERKLNIVGAFPVPAPGHVDPRMVSELLEHLMSSQADFLGGLLNGELAPDFDEKIEFNGLPDVLAQQLRAAGFQTHHVDAFLDLRPGLSQKIAEELRATYRRSGDVVPEEREDRPALRFVYILKELLPLNAGAQPLAHQQALGQIALIVMAKYFETCDIYERPIPTVTA